MSGPQVAQRSGAGHASGAMSDEGMTSRCSVGATAGGRLAHRLTGPAGAQVPAPIRRRWLTIALLGELGLVAVAGVVAVGLPVDAGGARRYAVIGLLAAGLGLQNATVRRLAVPDVTTTVLTLTLTGLAADSWLAGGHSPRAGRPPGRGRAHGRGGAGRRAAAAGRRRAAAAGRGGGDRAGRGGAPVWPVGASLCSLRALGVALTAIPWSRWQLAVPLLDRRPAGI
jgi:hypothetical protein